MRRECNVAAIVAASLCQVSGVRYVTVLAMGQHLLSRWGSLISSTMLSPPGGKRHRTIRVNLHNALQWSFPPNPLYPPTVYHQRLDDHHINSNDRDHLDERPSSPPFQLECSRLPDLGREELPPAVIMKLDVEGKVGECSDDQTCWQKAKTWRVDKEQKLNESFKFQFYTQFYIKLTESGDGGGSRPFVQVKIVFDKIFRFREKFSFGHPSFSPT